MFIIKKLMNTFLSIIYKYDLSALFFQTMKSVNYEQMYLVKW